MHTKWLSDLYHQLKADEKMIHNWFRPSGKSEAIKNAQDIMEKGENPFKEL